MPFCTYSVYFYKSKYKPYCLLSAIFTLELHYANQSANESKNLICKCSSTIQNALARKKFAKFYLFFQQSHFEAYNFIENVIFFDFFKLVTFCVAATQLLKLFLAFQFHPTIVQFNPHFTLPYFFFQSCDTEEPTTPASQLFVGLTFVKLCAKFQK